MFVKRGELISRVFFLLFLFSLFFYFTCLFFRPPTPPSPPHPPLPPTHPPPPPAHPPTILFLFVFTPPPRFLCFLGGGVGGGGGGGRRCPGDVGDRSVGCVEHQPSTLTWATQPTPITSTATIVLGIKYFLKCPPKKTLFVSLWVLFCGKLKTRNKEKQWGGGVFWLYFSLLFSGLSFFYHPSKPNPPLRVLAHLFGCPSTRFAIVVPWTMRYVA